MNCPYDSSLLEIRDIEGHMGYRCPKCRGKWLPRAYVQAIQHDRLFSYDEFATALAAAPTRETTLNCPTGCGRLVDVVDFAPSFSWCRSCQGIWFDKGELGQLIRRIPVAGGEWVIEDKSTSTGALSKLFPRSELPFTVELRYFIAAFVLIVGGLVVLHRVDSYIPTWILLGGIAFAAAGFIALIVDNYDERPDKWNYRRFARVSFVLALVAYVSGNFANHILRSRGLVNEW